MNAIKKKLIIFDCDGTLVDSEVIASKVFPSYWATHGVHFSENEFKEKFIGTGKSAPIVIETFSKMPDYANEEGDRILDEELSKHLCAVDGIPKLIESLGWGVCVASNSSLQYVKKALAKTKLDLSFGENIFSAEQVNNPKPAPDLFLYVANKLKVSPSECVVVEDSVSGVMAAKNANMSVVGFSGAGHFVPSLEKQLRETKPDWFCTSVGELESLLRKIT
jgi:HAD superfamily hydrolase (TIGR01509 family)